MNDTRKEGRLQVVLLARYREPTMLEPREGECRDLSPGGMFIMTPRPSPRGALIRFECSAQSAEDVFRGTGRVVWQRNKSDPRGSAGMGIRFVRLEAGSREALQRIVERVHQERQRTRSDSDRRTSSGPPPRVRTAEAVTQPVPILNAPGAENLLRPTPTPVLTSELRKATLRGVPVGSEGLPDLGPGLRSPLPPAPPPEPSSFTSTLPLHSSAPASTLGQVAADGVRSEGLPTTSPDRSVTVPLPPRNSAPQHGAEPGRIPSPLPPSGGPSALRERLDRTRRGPGSSSSGPPADATQAASDAGVSMAEMRNISPAGPTLTASSREHATASKGPSRESLNPATLRGGSNMDRTLLGRPSDRPPRPGGIDDLRTQRSPLPVKPEPGNALPEDSVPRLDEVEITSFAGGRRILPADRDLAPGPPLLPDLERMRKNAVPLWIVLGSGLVASAIVVRFFGSSPVGVPIASVVKSETPAQRAPAAAAEPVASSPRPATPATSVPPPQTPPAPPSRAAAPAAALAPVAGPAQQSADSSREGAAPGTVVPKPASEPAPHASAVPVIDAHPSQAADPPRHRAPKPPAPVPVISPPEPSAANPSTPAPPPTPAVVAAANPEPKVETKRPTAAAEANVQPTPIEQALDCLARGDNRCVIHALEDKATSARELELLIATYRAVGTTSRAEREMKRYLESFPNGPRASEYQRWLERRTAEPSPAAPATP